MFPCAEFVIELQKNLWFKPLDLLDPEEKDASAKETSRKNSCDEDKKMFSNIER